MDVPPGGKIHHGVATPANSPSHLLNFLGDSRSHRRVADVGVDLHQEVAADDHRLGFRVIDVRRNDGAAARHFLADKLRGDGFRDRSSEILARMLTRDRFGQSVSTLILADGDEFHLGRDHALSRVVHLRHVPPGSRVARLPLQAEAHVRELRIVQALVAVPRGRAGKLFGIVTLLDPFGAGCKQTLSDVDPRLRIRVRAGGVIDKDGWVFLRPERGRRVGLDDLAHRHKEVAARAFDVNFSRVRHGFDRCVIDSRGLGEKLRIGVHGAPLTYRPQGSEGTSRSTLPCGGIIRIRFEGFALTRPGKFARSGPLRWSKGPYSKRSGLASVSTAGAYREREPDAVPLAFAAVGCVRGERSN